MEVTLAHPELKRALTDYAAMARAVQPVVAKATLIPQSPAHQMAGLAAYAVWLADLHGMNDADWLRP